ncbi:uncharacterized protein SCHCODRAFT_02605229 [Schizophyllum commune H4-8]|uniref:uncharacterized protein n=1 Tax=Schizophyllum commune (strain H4-8 / FGSC 9210) TaxID=578458 RepID=UPI0021608DD7|nr:uncharacterized protein SCHCODRAFT_02605229 [Schizophyllum commune H4-8]KAI5899473.1 hypothetical protein SCHCODRAFT_02605229 [Schizophyllum commune H4-8]
MAPESIRLDWPPNLPVLTKAFDHIHATMTGTLAPGQELAKLSSVYMYLPKYFRIEEGTVFPQSPFSTINGSKSVFCSYSEKMDIRCSFLTTILVRSLTRMLAVKSWPNTREILV